MIKQNKTALKKSSSTLQVHRTVFLAFWAVLGFVAAQRFSIPNSSSLVCLAPLLGAITTFQKNPELRNTLLLLSLFWSTDIAVLELGATATHIRYLIYVVAVAAFFVDAKVQQRNLVISSIMAVFYLSITLFSRNELNETQLIRDLEIFTLLLILFVFKANRPAGLDFSILMVSITAYIVSELLNFFVFRDIWNGEYMNYDSTKYLVVLPSIVALLARKTLLSFTLICMTIPVLIGYSTRTLFLAYLVCISSIFLVFPMHLRRNKQIIAVAGALASILFLTTVVDYTSLFGDFKATAIIPMMQTHGFNTLEILDPVRFNESRLFFQLPTLELLFGRGFGSGIQDLAGYLDFVKLEQTAFSAQELNSAYYVNFHDFWVDIGLRFGLLPLSVFLLWFADQRPRTSREGDAVWLITLIGICCAFFSIAGIITIFILTHTVLALRDPETHATENTAE